MTSILIRNAYLVNEGKQFHADVLIHQGRIEKIASSISANADEEIDATGQWLLPGMIDDQVHFREPGLTHKGSIASESAAAVAGGITSFMDMPNTKPPTLSMAALANKKAIAAQHAIANYGFHFGVSKDNLDAVAALDPSAVGGIKVFMGASTGNLLVDDPNVLERLFSCAPTILITHCEHTPSILRNEEAWRESYGNNIPFSAHPLIRDTAACYQSSSFAVDLAKKHQTRLHVLHISTAKELDLFEDKPLTDKLITAEVCIHHLLFDNRDYARLGSHLKCNPAIKSTADRDALRAALNSHRLDVIGTDHAPHTLQEKAGNYFESPAGLPLVQHAMPGLMELVHDGVIDLPNLVAKTSHRVADLFKIADRGYLREGYWADLVLLGDRDLSAPDDVILSRCGWSPFTGRKFRSRVVLTVVSGRIAYQDGRLRPECRGQALVFSR
jgi:dihydroorotase